MQTRMHSSRIRTSHSLTVCRGGGGCLLPGGCLLLGGCLLPGDVSASGGCLLPRGCLFLGGLLLGGCLPQGMYIPACNGQTPTPPGETHTCKNITLATILRPVIIGPPQENPGSSTVRPWLRWLRTTVTVLGSF